MSDRLSAEITAPASAAQRGLWLVNELHPNTSLYNVFCSVRLTGRLDLGALHRAFAEVVARHEVLRTTFAVRDGDLYQRIAPAVPVPLPVTDLTALPAPQRLARAYRIADDWAELPFDLSVGPLFRATVLRVAAEEHVLGVAMHHSVCDGQSLTVLFDELAVLYAGGELARPPTRYRDFAAWQRAQEADQAPLAWWRGYLAGAPDVLTLPSDRPRPAVRGTAGATHSFPVPGQLVRAASAIAGRHRASPFMVLLTAYAALLGRLADVTELLVGAPVGQRPGPEYDRLIGLFVDTVAIRIDLTGHPTFGQLLEHVRASVLNAVGHSGVPFDRLVEQLRPDRAPSHTPLVQVVFSADLAPLASPRLTGLVAELRTPMPRTAKFDVDLTVQGAPDGSGDAVGVLTYSTELFDPDTAARFAERFVRLLAAGVAEPGTALRDLPLVGADERRTILNLWSEVAPVRTAPLVHELFSRQAAATPDAAAVEHDGEPITYAELDNRAERLADQLRSADIGSEEVVGVLAHRSVELFAALLAILKAGAAYLPLNPVHPPAYLARVLDAARVRRVVAAADLAHRLSGVEVLPMPTASPPEATRPAPEAPPARRVAPDNLAYVLFTSGSTGEPKGVAVTHRALANTVTTVIDYYRLTAADRVLQFANAGFDVAAEEVFPTWAAGGCVVLAPDPPPGPEAMTDLLRDNLITFTILTSSTWRRWVERAWRDGIDPAPTLRLVSIGAEPVDAGTLRRWLREVPVPLINAYGLTETTINATATRVAGPVEGATVPIGRPLDGVQVYVLDAELEPVPIGVPGQLYVGGGCLARGYVGRPDLTADRFVPHPFVPGARLHRTGDRARWRRDGHLEVLGRLDKQLKVRGYRIEPGHVEAALRGHPQITDAVVLARGDRLIGYVVPGDGLGLPPDLREHLASRLPVYLVPAAFVALPAIPLNANGKVDATALPEPAVAVPAAAAASSELEHALVEVWRDALGVEEVGIHDNFFEIGGGSLTLAAVHRRLRDQVGHPLPMVTLYEYPTIAALARHLASSGDPQSLPAEVARAPRRPRRPRRR